MAASREQRATPVQNFAPSMDLVTIFSFLSGGWLAPHWLEYSQHFILMVNNYLINLHLQFTSKPLRISC